MVATTYLDPTLKIGFLQARTNAAGAAMTDVDGEELRLPGILLTEGAFQADAFVVTAASGLQVATGSGTPKRDLAVVKGDADGQGNYLVRLESKTTIPLAAADLTNPRIDEVYLVVVDHAYDAGGLVKGRIAYRSGTAAASPVAPGPEATWKAFMLLATVEVPAGATTPGTITDNRVRATLAAALDPAMMDSYSEAETDALLAGKAPLVHSHLETDLPNASTAAQGVVQLNDTNTSTSTSQAATANAAKKAYDRAGTADSNAAAASTKAGTRLLPHTGVDSQVIVSTGAPSGGQNGDIWLRV